MVRKQRGRRTDEEGKFSERIRFTRDSFENQNLSPALYTGGKTSLKILSLRLSTISVVQHKHHIADTIVMLNERILRVLR